MIKTKSGFTIVELLITIVIISILAVISVVAYNGVQERARMSTASSYASQLRRSPDVLDATAVYTFDECSGGTVRDSSEKANNGTIQGTVNTSTWSTDTPNGSGCSLYFNGTNRVTTNAEIGSTFYIKAAWVKITNCGGTNNIISSNAASSYGSALYNCRLRSGHNGQWNTVDPGANVLSANKWHYVVAKYENSTLTLYVDGKQVASASSVSPPGELSNVLGALSNSNFFGGYMDDVIIIAR